MIVDDQRLFAEAIQLTLEAMGMEVVAVATNGEQALDAVREHLPDVVLMDLGLPDRSGVEVGQRILEGWPAIKVIAVTATEDAHTVKETLRVGFGGYITKDTDAERFGRAIRSVVDGHIVLPQKLGQGIGLDGDRTVDDDLLVRQLTLRELEVLNLLAEGATSHHIAQSLGVSPNTVRTHVQGILSKLQVHSRLEAAAFAVRHGLVDVPP